MCVCGCVLCVSTWRSLCEKEECVGGWVSRLVLSCGANRYKSELKTDICIHVELVANNNHVFCEEKDIARQDSWLSLSCFLCMLNSWTQHCWTRRSQGLSIFNANTVHMKETQQHHCIWSV
jgi:hypothetical protein